MVITVELLFRTLLGQESVPNREVSSFQGQNVHNPNVIRGTSPVPRVSRSGHPWDRKVSLIERCPNFWGQNVHNTNAWDNTICSD